MKTKLTILIANLFCIIGIAQTFTEDGFNYNVISTNPNEVEVTGGTDGSSPLTFRSTVTDNGITYTVTTIGNSAYRNGVSNVILPNTITTIKFRAFRDNGGLTSITLPASVTSIGGEAFFGGGLNEIIAEGTIPASISNSSFGTRANVDLIVPNGLEDTYISGGWTGFNTINGEIPIGGTFDVGDLRYRVISQNPLEVEVAGRLNGIVDIVIPETVVEPQFIDTYTVTAIGSNAFRNAGVNSVVFSNTIEVIKNDAFEINNLTTVTLPVSLITIGNEAFNLNPLTEIISQAVAAPTIGTNSIVNTGNISLTVPSGSEASYVTSGWTGFFSINGTPFIGSDFSADGFNYRINGVNPNTVELRGGGTGITDLVLPSTTTKNGVSFTVNAITNRAFRNRGINSVVLPSTIETIGFEVFEINSLTTITLPAAVTTIADQAFNLNPLTEVISEAVAAPTIEPNSIVNRGNINLTVPSGSEASYVTGGWTGFFSINGTPFIGSDFSADGFNYRINGVNPNTVELRGGGSGITDLVLPSTATKNGVSFTVTVIVDRVFRGRSLNSVTLPNNVEVIGIETFENNNLTTITLPASVTIISSESFNSNPLTEVISQAVAAPTLTANSFTNRGNISLTVPSGSEAAYVTNGWTGFFSINGTPFIGSSFSVNGFNYTINGVNPNTVELTGGATGIIDLVLPPTTTKNGISFTVSAIGFRAFRSKSINSVVFPASIEVIGAEAFELNNLSTITIPASVTTISEDAFLNNSLAEVIFTSGPETIGINAFRGNQLTNVSIPSGTVTIGNGAFINNQIASITLPNTVDLIDRDAFRNNQLTNVNIPTGVITVGRDAFRDNILTNVIFPTTVETIDIDAFRGNQITSLTLPNSITNIGEGAFRENQLTNVVIPNSITVIKSQTFRNNVLTSVTFPNNLETIRNDAFRNNQLATINLPSSLTTLEGFSFRDNQLTSVTIPSTISSIGSNTFRNNQLTNITIPANITSIEAEAFSGNPLNTITADSATPAIITSSSFSSRGTINVFIIPDQQSVIDDYIAAGWTGFGSVNGEFQVGAEFTEGDLRYQVTALNPNTVKVLNRVTIAQNIVIPTTITESISGTSFNITDIENAAFQNTDITTITLGDNIQTIGNTAFQNTNITTVILPASITTIGANAFSTTTLGQIEALGTTPATIDATSFGERENIALTVPSSNETDYENAGWTGFFTINGNGLAVGSTFTVNAIRYEILTLAPNTLSAVGKNGTVPNGDFIFPELISKNGVDFTITTIGNSAFRSRDVQTISLPSTVTTLAFRAFRDNGSLTSTNIPANITSIGGEAFFNTGLTEIISESVNPPTISNGAINGRSDIDLFIPQGTMQAYIDANWTGFKSIIEQGTLVLEPKVYLQGASLNPNTGEETLMRDDLRVANLIPTTSPYSDGATCDSAVFNETGDNAIVDWVFVELRDASNNTTVIEGKSALLQRDGDVVDVNGKSILQFTSPLDNYFVVIQHRNHLGIMTANAVSLTGTKNIVDFTDATSQITLGSNAQTDAGMPVDTVGMWTGNVNSDDIVQYSGTDPDAPAILSLVLNDVGNFLNFSTFIVNGYNINDVNMDGKVQYEGVTPDAPFILQNILAHPGNFLNFSTFQIQEQLPEN